MKPSKPFKYASLVLGVSLALTSCSLLRVKTEVSAQQVKLDLTLGAPPVAGIPTPGELDLPTITLPTLPEFEREREVEPPPPPPPPECPPHPPQGAGSKVSDPDVNINDSGDPEQDDTPLEGEYQFRYEYNYEGGEATYAENYKVLEIAPDDATTGQRGRDVENNELRFSVDDLQWNIKMHFRTVGVERADGTPNANPGLYLTQIDLPLRDRSLENRHTFDPEPDLLLMRFPIQNDMNILSTASDRGLKNDLPIPGTPGRPSPNQMQSEVTVGAKELVEACFDYADAWKVNWDLRITGEFPIIVSGLFWFSTAFGGWPVREEFVASSQRLISGNFSSNIMSINPTGYL